MTGDGPSGNAPLHALYAGTDRDVLERFAAAFGDKITQVAPDATPRAYDSVHGMWRLDPTYERIDFFGTGEEWIDRDGFLDALASLGLSGESFLVGEPQRLPGETTLTQLFRNGNETGPIAFLALSSLEDQVSQGEGYGWFTNIDLDAVRDLSNASVIVEHEAGLAFADAYVLCRADWPGVEVTEFHSFAVAFDSLTRTYTYQYPTAEAHCTTSSFDVHVDAFTGSVLQVEEHLCY